MTLYDHYQMLERKAELKSLVARLEQLAAEMKAVQEDRRDTFAEAKEKGFNLDALRALLLDRSQGNLA